MMPSPDELQASLKLLEDTASDVDFFLANLEGLRKEHGDEFVAIRNGKVVLHDATVDRIFEQIAKQGLEANRFVVEFVPAKGSLLAC